jgi:nicotinate phosphoribosyltransferase
MADRLGPRFAGTSNTHLARTLGLEAVGTNAHELPMVLAALAKSDEELKSAQYRVLDLWRRLYSGGLLVFLPDTFGTTQFLRDAPGWVAGWAGARPDSKEPFLAGREFIDWWRARGEDPKSKLLLFSDGLDAESMLALDARFCQEARLAFGWGTLATNDFRACHPGGAPDFDPLSLVCKVAGADGRPAVKLSDNDRKATGPEEELARYRRVFGSAGIADAPILV